jgi:hypothetical protein
MKNSGIIIGISGKKRSGKDHIGKYIQQWNDTFINKKFADKVKDIVCLLLGCTRLQLEDEEWRTTPLNEDWWVYTDGISMTPYYGGNTRMLDGYNTIVQKTTPRLLMQLIGTECGRQIIHPNIWVNATMASFVKEYRGLPSEYKPGLNMGTYPNWVITDVRFTNEVDAIVKRGGHIIRVERPGIEYNDTHESETALDNVKFRNTIINDGTLEDLDNKICSLLLKLKIPFLYENE